MFLVTPRYYVPIIRRVPVTPALSDINKVKISPAKNGGKNSVAELFVLDPDLIGRKDMLACSFDKIQVDLMMENQFFADESEAEEEVQQWKPKLNTSIFGLINLIDSSIQSIAIVCLSINIEDEARRSCTPRFGIRRCEAFEGKNSLGSVAVKTNDDLTLVSCWHFRKALLETREGTSESSVAVTVKVAKPQLPPFLPPPPLRRAARAARAGVVAKEA